MVILEIIWNCLGKLVKLVRISMLNGLVNIFIIYNLFIYV